MNRRELFAVLTGVAVAPAFPVVAAAPAYPMPSISMDFRTGVVTANGVRVPMGEYIRSHRVFTRALTNAELIAATS